MLLIGRATREICFNQSEAASTTQIWVVTCYQYGIFARVPQTPFGGKTSGGVGKCLPFSQAWSIPSPEKVFLRIGRFLGIRDYSAFNPVRVLHQLLTLSLHFSQK